MWVYWSINVAIAYVVFGSLVVVAACYHTGVKPKPNDWLWILAVVLIWPVLFAIVWLVEMRQRRTERRWKYDHEDKRRK